MPTFGVRVYTPTSNPSIPGDLDGAFERVQAGDADVVQEPVEQPYGVRDCAVRDSAGNPIRIQEAP
nr:hypothetical protein [Jiangella rhizosphaerae]